MSVFVRHRLKKRVYKPPSWHFKSSVFLPIHQPSIKISLINKLATSFSTRNFILKPTYKPIKMSPCSCNTCAGSCKGSCDSCSCGSCSVSPYSVLSSKDKSITDLCSSTKCQRLHGLYNDLNSERFSFVK